MLPPRYVPLTLQRLLPTPEQLKRLSHDQLLKLWDYKAKLQQLIEDFPAKFLVPNKPGQESYMLCDDPDLIGQFFFAGNKSGKTTATCIKVIERLAGQPIWGIDPPYSRGSCHWPAPSRWVFFTEDFQTHEEVIVPTYLSWCPRWLQPQVLRGPNGMCNYILHGNGSILYLRTYEQGFEKAEGKDYDGAAFDEPPPRELYVAVFRGMVARGGKIFIGATLLKEAWLFDELQNNFNKGFNGEIFDNPWLDRKTLTAFEATLSDDERAVRLHGKPITMVGLIYPELRDSPPFVVAHRRPWNPEREVPYPTVIAVDPHERLPLHLLWAVVTPSDKLIAYDWKLIRPGTFDEIFGFVDQIEAEHASLGWTRSSLCIMDPNHGAQQQAGETTWQEQFELHGHPVILGIDELTVGHTAVRTALFSQQLVFTEQCRGTGGPLHGMMRYSWDDWQRRIRDKKALKEVPKENFKHWPDCIRYLVMAGLTFDSIMHGGDAINLNERGPRRLRAYA